MVAVMAALSNLYHGVHHSVAKIDPVFGLTQVWTLRVQFWIGLGSDWPQRDQAEQKILLSMLI